IDYKVFYGDIPMSPSMGVADFFNTTGLYSQAGVRDLGMKYTAGAQVFWNTPITGLKFGYSYSYFKDLQAAGPFAYVPTADVVLNLPKYEYHTLSAEYIRGQWTFATEWSRVGGDTKIANPLSTSYGNTESDNWYVAAARRINDKFEIGAYFSQQLNNTA